MQRLAIGYAVAIALASAPVAYAGDDIFAAKATPAGWPVFGASAPYDWSGFYAGGHLGYEFGRSNWSAGGQGGALGLYQPFDPFKDTGSFVEGLQVGYNYLWPNRILIGGEADAAFPSFQSAPAGANPFGVSVGGITTFNSATLGQASYAETALASGTLRGRVGYAPGRWLFYATGGLAWSFDRQSLTQTASGAVDQTTFWRLGYVAGAGVEVPVAPHWTAQFEYLFNDYGRHNNPFFGGAQPFASDVSVQQIRAGLNYQFGGDQAAPPVVIKALPAPAADIVNFHGQATFTEQAYPGFRSAFQGTNSLPAGGQGRETFDTTLFAGIRLWQGAELWINPEIDQGFGLQNTLGAAGFPSAEAYKVGFDYPYARLPRTFIRQTIDLGGGTQKVEPSANQFAGTQTADRLVITVGKFSVTDVFDTNKYAHDPRSDFLNWAMVDTGTFDYAADAWAYTYGAAVEWYRGDWTFRGGLFDLSVVPNSADLDPNFSQIQWVGEIERRWDLWGHAGKLAVTGFLSRGRMGSFQNAIDLAVATGTVPNAASVRTYQSRGGISMTMEQEITGDLGAFLRAGWADGTKEPFEFTDIDRTVAAGLVLTGKQWNRPDDTIGVAGLVNGLAPVHQAYLAAGGLGILVGDGALPNYGLEQVIEAYYSYGVTASFKITADYQLIINPAYNADRGPVNVFAGRAHYAF
jgi:high affinity Mn2+ porin